MLWLKDDDEEDSLAGVLACFCPGGLEHICRRKGNLIPSGQKHNPRANFGREMRLLRELKFQFKKPKPWFLVSSIE
jgi:hypothetical protein